MIEFVKGYLSFPGTASRNGKWTADDDRLTQLMEVFGPFPDTLLKMGARSQEFFADKGMQILASSSSTSLSPSLLLKVISYLKKHDWEEI